MKSLASPYQVLLSSSYIVKLLCKNFLDLQVGSGQFMCFYVSMNFPDAPEVKKCKATGKDDHSKKEQVTAIIHDDNSKLG